MKTVISLEVTKGHLKWTVSELARRTGGSRARIYYHFGSTKAEILRSCIEIFATDYFSLSGDRMNTLAAGHGLESLVRTRKMFLENPDLAVFYQKWRMKDSPLKRVFLAIESKYQAKLQKSFPDASKTDIIAIHAIFHGLITAPFLTEEGMVKGFKAAMSITKGKKE